ncbi:MAG: P-loop NTPase fold protein [Fulvivirga sp.]
MTKSTYDFSSFSEKELVEMSRDILNISFKFNLNLAIEGNGSYYPDLWQQGKESIEVAAQIFGPQGIEFPFNDKYILDRTLPYLKDLKPKRFFILLFTVYDNESSDFQFRNSLSQHTIEFKIFDLTWIQKQLDDQPEIAEKWFKKSTEIELTSFASFDQWQVNPSSGKSRSFFAAGHHYNGTDNQLPRFVKDGIWENGHDDKFKKAVKSVEVGDILFAKSSWAKSGQGFLTINGVGVVTKNFDDGHQLGVKWHVFENRIDLTVGAHYRNALNKIQPDYISPILDSILDRQPDLPDIIQNLSNKGTDHNEIASLIQSNIDSGADFWWINAGEKWTIDSLQVGEKNSYRPPSNSKSSSTYISGVSPGDLLIGFQAVLYNGVVGLLRITTIDEDGRYHFELLYKFQQRTTLDKLKSLPLFSQSSLSKSLQGSLHTLTPELFEEILNTTELSLPDGLTSKKLNQSKIASLSHDAIDGEDYLGIEKDVTSFAKVIASNSFTPPLAIALFGQWGTGKSFFMKKLMKRIDMLATSGNDFYRAGIAQIHFNAWSYLDTNLFASIVAEVFEKLDEYISGNKKSEVRIKNIENELTDKLSIAGKQRELLREKKETQIKNIRGLRKKILVIKKESKDKIEEIKSKNSKMIFDEVDKDLNMKTKLKDAVSQLSIKSDELGEINPDSLLSELKSGQNFIRESLKLARNDNWGILVLILLGIVSVGLSFIPAISSLDITIPQVITIIVAPIPILWKSIKGAIGLLTPVITKVNSIRDQREKRLKEIESKYEQEVEAAKLEIEIKNQEILSFQEEIHSLESDYSKINYLLKHNLKQQAVYSFINERNKSEEYQKYLGVVSTIRKDFEILSDLFDQSKDDGREFRDNFERPLERIVLYIDDLDRCKEDQVIQVLEAVNLLMAFPLFIVVVGVDPRWVKNALIKEYHMQFAGVKNKMTTGIEPIEASNYLEKIFQVPFHLEEAQDESVKEMIKNLGTSSTIENVTTEVDDKPKKRSDATPRSETTKPEAVPIKEKVSNILKKVLPKQESELLSLSDREVELLQEMSGIIGTNPRAIKRFVNVYQIVRAHEGLGTTPGTDEEYLVLMILLALPIGNYKSLYKHTMRLSPDEFHTFGDFLKHIDKSNQDDLQAKKLEEYIESTSNKGLILGLRLDVLIKQNEFIRRFTFSEIA